MLSCWSAGGDEREGVQLRAELAQRLDQFDACRRAAQVGGLHQREGPAAQRLGHLRQRREAHDAAERGDLVGHRAGPQAPRVQHLRAAIDREEQHPGIQFAHRVQPHLQRGHHPDAAAAAADRPEQVRLVVRVGAHEASVRGHEFHCGDAVGGQPVAAGQPAHPAAEGIAGHADVRGGARERGQAVLPGGDGHVPPDGAGPGPGGVGGRVDAHPLHPRRPEQQRAFE
jgi:hypothetical protein